MPQMTLLALMAALAALFALLLPSGQEEPDDPRAEALARHFVLFRRACADAAADHPGTAGISSGLVLDYLPMGTAIPDGWLCLREGEYVYACGAAGSPDWRHVAAMAPDGGVAGVRRGAVLVPGGGAAPAAAAEGAVVLGSAVSGE